MDIFHVSAECYPAAKVGGLADVVGALPKYQNLLGHLAKVVLPAYDNKFLRENAFDTVHNGKLKLGIFNFSYSILKESTDKLGFELFMIAIPELFDRPNVYSYEDDTERFTAFQVAFLDWLTETNQNPELIHCHDHHAGLIPFMIKNAEKYQQLKEIPTVLTIHNAQYQGQFSFDKLAYLPEYDLSQSGLLEWNGLINPLASAIKCAWKVTTVSPSYLEEISHAANGLENLLLQERSKCVGILNGIDNQVWNPESDALLSQNYSVDDFEIGKQKNKELLCERFHLNADKPLFSFIGRLVADKGADLLPHICSIAFTEHPQEINILILGSGDSHIEKTLETIKPFFSGNYNVVIGYDEKLAHLIYAGADFLLMPSRVEPCGLNQLYSMRYGTIPIVRRTGGLKDTVGDMGEGGLGVCHEQASVPDVVHAIGRAVDLYKNQDKFNDMRKENMKINHSWEKVAGVYINVYELLTSKV